MKKLEDRKNYLNRTKRSKSEGKIDENSFEINNPNEDIFVKNTFGTIRQLIIAKKPFEEIHKTFPQLFEEKNLINHFQALTNCQQLTNFDQEKIQHVIRFLTNQTETNNEPLLLQFLEVLARHFKKNLESLYVTVVSGRNFFFQI